MLHGAENRNGSRKLPQKIAKNAERRTATDETETTNAHELTRIFTDSADGNEGNEGLTESLGQNHGKCGP